MADKSYKRIERILKEPLTRHRRILVQIFQNKDLEFPREGLDKFIEMLPQTPYLEREVENLKHALEKGECKWEPNIATPENQLMWAAALIYIEKGGNTVQSDWPYEFKNISDISQTRIWKQLTESSFADAELKQHAYHLASTVRNPETRIGWNKPGTWFYYSPDENRINLDFMNSLLGGFEHTRSVVFHEIAHSQLTVRFTKRMRAIYEEMKELKERAQENKKAAGNTRYNVKGKLSKEEYKRLAMLSAEFNLWMKLFNVAEDNCVNRYSANKSKELAQDYGRCLDDYIEFLRSAISRSNVVLQILLQTKFARGQFASIAVSTLGQAHWNSFSDRLAVGRIKK